MEVSTVTTTLVMEATDAPMEYRKARLRKIPRRQLEEFVAEHIGAWQSMGWEVRKTPRGVRVRTADGQIFIASALEFLEFVLESRAAR